MGRFFPIELDGKLGFVGFHGVLSARSENRAVLYIAAVPLARVRQTEKTVDVYNIQHVATSYY